MVELLYLDLSLEGEHRFLVKDLSMDTEVEGRLCRIVMDTVKEEEVQGDMEIDKKGAEKFTFCFVVSLFVLSSLPLQCSVPV